MTAACEGPSSSASEPEPSEDPGLRTSLWKTIDEIALPLASVAGNTRIRTGKTSVRVSRQWFAYHASSYAQLVAVKPCSIPLKSPTDEAGGMPDASAYCTDSQVTSAST